MTITRHPDIATLMTCSAGSQPEALCAVIVSHIAQCPQCRSEYSRMESIGVALFEGLSANGSPAATSAPLGEPQPTNEAETELATIVDVDVPAPLRPVVGDRLDDLSWRPLRTGVDHYPIALSNHARGDLRLLRLQPDAHIPWHDHDGEELSLVLRGACEDAYGRYCPGDFADLDDDSPHSIATVGARACIILVGSETRPQFARP